LHFDRRIAAVRARSRDTCRIDNLFASDNNRNHVDMHIKRIVTADPGLAKRPIQQKSDSL